MSDHFKGGRHLFHLTEERAEKSFASHNAKIKDQVAPAIVVLAVKRTKWERDTVGAASVLVAVVNRTQGEKDYRAC